MKKILKQHVLVAALVFGNTLSANQDCSELNTTEFVQDLDADVLKACALQDEERLFEKPDSAGSILLHKVISYADRSDAIDAIKKNSSDDSWKRQLEQDDKSGRTAMQIAVEEAQKPELLLRLIARGGDPFGEAYPKREDQLLGLSLTLKNREDFAAVLHALGSKVKKSGRVYSSLTAKALANPGKYRPERWHIPAVTHSSGFSTDQCAQSPDELSREALDGKQQAFCAVQLYAKKPLMTDADGNTFLHAAIKNGFDTKFIDAFFFGVKEVESSFGIGGSDNRGRVLKSENVEGLSALGMAAKFASDPNVITHLIGWGADLEQLQGKSQSLHLAASRSEDLRFKMLSRLLAGGAEPQAQDTKGNTALHLLMRKSHLPNPNMTSDAIILLMEAQLASQRFSNKIEIIHNDAGATPLHLAVVRHLGASVFSELLYYNADPDQLDKPVEKDGKTPAARSALFSYASIGRDPNVFKLLLDRSENACDDAINVEGTTLQMALANNSALRATKTTRKEFAMSLLNKKCG